jgi:hypothetical protein
MIATIVAAAAVHFASDTTTNGTASRELKRRGGKNKNAASLGANVR